MAGAGPTTEGSRRSPGSQASPRTSISTPKRSTTNSATDPAGEGARPVGPRLGGPAEGGAWRGVEARRGGSVRLRLAQRPERFTTVRRPSRFVRRSGPAATWSTTVITTSSTAPTAAPPDAGPVPADHDRRGGEEFTLRIAAKHADTWNYWGDLDMLRGKLDVLRDHCETYDTDFDAIEKSWFARCVIRGTEAEVEELLDAVPRFRPRIWTTTSSTSWAHPSRWPRTSTATAKRASRRSSSSSSTSPTPPGRNCSPRRSPRSSTDRWPACQHVSPPHRPHV